VPLLQLGLHPFVEAGVGVEEGLVEFGVDGGFRGLAGLAAVEFLQLLDAVEPVDVEVLLAALVDGGGAEVSL
jgi:hypothetical protein